MTAAAAPRRRPLTALTSLATLLAVVLAGLLCVAGPAAADTRPTLAPDESLSVASQAAGWLAGSIVGSDGAVHDPSGKSDPVTTAWAALAMRATGLEPESTRPAGWLEQHPDALARDSGRDSPAGLAMLILIARAENRPAEAFGGQDLVARLLATRGPDGLFGPMTILPNSDPVGGVASRQGLVLSALGSAGRTDAGAADWLEQRQCPDGGWQFRRVDPTSSCSATPDVTGYAMMGLAAVGREVPRRAIRALERMQQPDGGFGLNGTVSDSLGTALALQGLIAAGQDPNTQQWRKGTGADSATPFDVLLRFATDTSGGFSLQPNGPPDPSLTSRVIPAAAGQPLPLAAPDPLGADSSGQDPNSSGTTATSATSTSSDSFSAISLLGAGAVALAVIGVVYGVRRRRQAI